jgi:hypothetical protein
VWGVAGRNIKALQDLIGKFKNVNIPIIEAVSD